MLKFLELPIGLIGIAVVWHATSWEVALGVFIMLFANNLGHSKNIP